MQQLTQQTTCLMNITRKQAESQALAKDVEAFLAGRQQPSALAALAEQEAKAAREAKIKHAAEDARQQAKAKVKKANIVETKVKRKSSGSVSRVRSDQGSKIPSLVMAAVSNGPVDARNIYLDIAERQNVSSASVQSVINRMIDRGELVAEFASTPMSKTRVIAIPAHDYALQEAAKLTTQRYYKNHFDEQVAFIQSVGSVTVDRLAEHFAVQKRQAQRILTILTEKEILVKKTAHAGGPIPFLYRMGAQS